MVEYMACGETEEEVATLYITHRTQAEGPNGSWLHGVIMFLMHLYIFPKLQLAMCGILDMVTSKDGSGTHSL